MATIDIRDESVQDIKRIVFTEQHDVQEFVELSCYSMIAIEDSSARRVAVYLHDIPNLIKALQKAQELWA